MALSQGLLCRWALAMQEYNFNIVYRSGSSNGNADDLSRSPLQATNQFAPVAVTSVRETSESLQQQQQQTDSILQQVYNALPTSTDKPMHWQNCIHHHCVAITNCGSPLLIGLFVVPINQTLIWMQPPSHFYHLPSTKVSSTDVMMFREPATKV